MLPEQDTRCLYCYTYIQGTEEYEHYRVCYNCGFHYSMDARKRVDLLCDPGSFREIFRSFASLDPISFAIKKPYPERLSEAQKFTGLREAVITGTCRIQKTRVVVAALDFGFLGGSMGSVVGEKMAMAFERASEQKLPLVALVTSGGARVQEGLLSLMQMAKTAAAAVRLHQEGSPFIAVLGNPVTGQVYASFANLADIIIAEPGALLGYAPLRDVEVASGKPLPPGAHTAESHLKHGLIDMVVPRDQLRSVTATLLKLLTSQSSPSRLRGKRRKGVRRTEGRAWESVQLARTPERPSASYYIGSMISSFIGLHGDRLTGDDSSIIAGVGYLNRGPVMVIGQEWKRPMKDRDKREGLIKPEGFRKAQRAMSLAAKFHLPVVTLIDTPGASRSLEAEEKGIGNAIASTLALMSQLPTPVVSVFIGEGGSEAALTLGIGDRILMMDNAIFASVSPEGAAALLYRDSGRAEEVADSLKLTAQDCKKLGIIDVIVPEPEGGAHTAPEDAALILERQIIKELRSLRRVKAPKLLEERYKRLRHMGQYSSDFRDMILTALARGVKGLKGRLSSRGRVPDPGT